MKKTKTENLYEATLGGIGGTLIDDSEKIDITSGTWISIKNNCLNRMQTLRESNDNPQLTDNQTAVIRGQIKELKELLDLAKPKPEMFMSEDIL